MPHPRKHLKQSGDLHPPEVESDLGGDDDAMGGGGGAGGDREREASSTATAGVQESAGAARAMSTPTREPAGDAGSFRFGPATEHYLDAAREQVRRKPVPYAAGAFVIGFLLAIITR